MTPLKEELVERVEELKLRARQAVNSVLKSLGQELRLLRENRNLQDPLAIFEIQFQRLDELKKNLNTFFINFVELEKEKLFASIGKLEALGPLATLKRGFSVTLGMPGEKVLTSARRLKAGDLVKTRLSDGFFISQVKETGA